MKLAELQAALARHALHGETDAALAEAVVDRQPGAEARLGVYRELVEEAHLDALGPVFPVTVAVLGKRYWRSWLRADWDGPGSEAVDLGSYGAFVPVLLGRAVATRTELADLPYLPELARLEWAVHEAVGRTGPERFDWTAFSRLSEAEQAQVRLVPSPSLTKLRLAAPVDEIWRRHRGGVAEEGLDEGSEGPWLCCLHPTGRFDVGVSRWPAEEEALLDRLLGGPSLAALEELATGEGLGRLHGWIEQGWIVGFATE